MSIVGLIIILFLRDIQFTGIILISLGIAYSFQKCKKIPINNHDFKLDYIFTEKGIIKSNIIQFYSILDLLTMRYYLSIFSF